MLLKKEKLIPMASWSMPNIATSLPPKNVMMIDRNTEMAATVCVPNPFMKFCSTMLPKEAMPDWMAGGKPNLFPRLTISQCTILFLAENLN